MESEKKSVKAKKPKAVKKAPATKEKKPRTKQSVDEFGLTATQRAFADALLEDPNCNKQDAYFKVHPHVKLATARVGATNMSKLPKVQAYLQAKRDAISKKCEINAEWVLRRLVAEAEADIADLYTAQGSLKPIHQWPEIWRKGLIIGMDVKQDFAYDGGEKVPDGLTVKIKYSDRVNRIKMIGDHIGVQAFTQQVNHGIQKDNPIADLIKAIAGSTLEPAK